jgi:cation transporter-like permease
MLAELVFIAVLPVVAKTSYRCGLDPDILPPN